MKGNIKEILTTMQDLFGDEIFHDAGRLKAAMADLFAGGGYKKSRNLLNIAFADLRAYSRMMAIERRAPLIVDILAKEMSRDYDILETSAWAVISCIGEIAGIVAGDAPGAVRLSFEADQLAPLTVGDTVFFGKYYWRVLRVVDEIALVICEEIIGLRRYGQSDCRDWFSSEIRQYLNETFYSKFTPTDKKRVIQAHNHHSHDEARDTLDYVSLLNPGDANILFDDNADRVCKYNSNNCSWWLLSDPGTNSRNGAIVTSSGKISDLTAGAEGGIRPVLRLKI